MNRRPSCGTGPSGTIPAMTPISPRSVKAKVRRALKAGATVRELSELAGLGRSWHPRILESPETTSYRVLFALSWACDKWRPTRGTKALDGAKAAE
jgi:hypothetical protein